MAADPPATRPVDLADDPRTSSVPADAIAVDSEPSEPENPLPVTVDNALVSRRVVPLRHPWCWTATVIVLVLLAQFVHGLVSNPFYEWDRFRYWFLRSVILEGLGLIAATTKKDNGLAAPLADAINYLIKNGQYDAWLKAYNLTNEAVPTSLINPPGLPITNS